MKNVICALTITALGLGCSKAEHQQAKPATATTRFEITVTENGFEPDKISVPSGKPVTLVFTRKTEKTCAKEVVLEIPDGQKTKKELPIDTAVEIAATFPKAGELKYACGMDMVTGVITVQ